jgi:hypothetical protein
MSYSRASGARFSMPTRQARRAGIVAAGLVAAGLQAAPANAALVEVRRVPYQEQVTLECTGSSGEQSGCRGFFIQLKPRHTLELSHVRCLVTVTSGVVNNGSAYYLPQDPPFTVPFASIWTRTAGIITRYTLDAPLRFTVPRDAQFVVYFDRTGVNANGHCVATGERVIYEQQ